MNKTLLFGDSKSNSKKLSGTKGIRRLTGNQTSKWLQNSLLSSLISIFPLCVAFIFLICYPWSEGHVL
jgi:hypothetical protein